MIDVCPQCRIQAPHRPGRDRCPRCGGPLQVVHDAAQARTVAGPGSLPVPPIRPVPGPPRPMTFAPPSAAAPAATRRPPAGPPPHRPAPARPSGFYRPGNVRWIARRPPEAIPPRRTRAPSGPRLVPRYTYLPQWGLRDRPVTPTSAGSPADGRQTMFEIALLIAGTTFALCAAAHLYRYILAMINRTRLVSETSDTLSHDLVGLTSLGAGLGFLIATTALVSWVLEFRERSYAGVDRLDPRPQWLVVPLTAIPLVNVIGAPFLICEAAVLRADLDQTLLIARLKKMWLAWALVNAVAIVALVARVVQWNSGTIQSDANSLEFVTLSYLVSAVFAFWLAWRLRTVLRAEEATPAPTRRWVAVA